MKYIYVMHDYENFAKSTKLELASTLACSSHSTGQAKVEQAPIKRFYHRNFQMPVTHKCI